MSRFSNPVRFSSTAAYWPESPPGWHSHVIGAIKPLRDWPGDDDLENVMDAGGARFDLPIVEGVLDRVTPDMLDEEIRRPEWGDEIDDILGRAGLEQIDLWS